MDTRTEVTNAVHFRGIHESDKWAIKAMHEDLFPIRYSDTFYDDVCSGKGLNGRDLFSSIITINIDGKDIIIGFILAQFGATDQAEDTGLFGSTNEPKEVLYILTLGLRQSYRREGYGSRLIDKCIEYARRNPLCGAVSNLKYHAIHILILTPVIGIFTCHTL